MVKKLYVGNLWFGTTEEALNEAFSQAGTVVKVTVLKNKITGESRGFGFVEMEEADADKAVEMWNGKELGGRKLVVNEARPLEQRAA